MLWFRVHRLTYINAVVLESLRMFMGRTMNIPHRALKDTYIMGHKIPKVVYNFFKNNNELRVLCEKTNGKL